jgi:protein phosphatase 1G
LDLEPDTKTSLFAGKVAAVVSLQLLPLTHKTRNLLPAVFDGHGGRAVSQYCAAHLTEEFVRSAAYRRGDLAAAISEAYFRLDELLESAEGRAELRQLVSSSKPT